MNFAVLVFPGSNSDLDSYHAVKDTLDQPVDLVWHSEADLSKYDCIIIPGGASYGDYLRPGAIASVAPVMEAVAQASQQGKLIVGIGNGFQILLESDLLPGTVRQNESLKFQCQQTKLRVENNQTPFTVDYSEKEEINIPIANYNGNYYCDEATLAQLKANNQILFRYADDNPNGSVDHIAGICNEQGNVIGMMPHPERAVNQLLGSEDGKRMFTSILRTWREKHGAAIGQ